MKCKCGNNSLRGKNVCLTCFAKQDAETQRTKPKHIEANIQASFFELIGVLHPELDKLIYHISNEGKRNARFVKKSGIKKGVPDVFLSKPNKDYHGLYIEFKTTEGKQSKDQQLFQEQVEKVGYKYSVCRSANEGLEVVKEYLKDAT